jgi:hypothetical protein
MALAKYLEDIEDRRQTDISPRYEKWLSAMFNTHPTPDEVSGDVHLERNGRRMEDVEICEVGEKLILKIQCPEGAGDPVVELQTAAGYAVQKQTTGGQVTISFDDSGARRLQVASGGYIKAYELNVVEPFSPDTLPDFAKLVHELAENPPQWNDESFRMFRVEVEGILQKAQVPQMFTDGIIEYHLSLFQEEREIPQYNDRLEAAYGALRWFAPYSDLAGLVCAFFMYRANEFAASRKICSSQFARLRGALDFFCAERPPTRNGRGGKQEPAQRLPMLIPFADLLCLQSIQRLNEEKLEEAAELVQCARNSFRGSLDPERAARLDLIEARLRKLEGNYDRSQIICDSLKLSPWQSIRERAREL